jgi:hypothetical protein
MWGRARGPLNRAAPPVRLLAGLLVLGAVLAAPASPLGAAVASTSALAWALAARPPARWV